MNIYPALKLAMAVAAMLVAATGQVQADLLTFEDVSGGSIQDASGNMPVYKGYSFSSTNAWVDVVGSQFGYGAHGGEFAILNNNQGVGIITDAGGGDFTFDGLWAKQWATKPESGGADTLLGTLEGWNNGVQVWSVNTGLNGSYEFYGPQAGAIDELRLGFGNIYLVDDITLNSVAAVPEPEIYAMMGVGLGLLGWVGRRKKLKEAAAA